MTKKDVMFSLFVVCHKRGPKKNNNNNNNKKKNNKM